MTGHASRVATRRPSADASTLANRTVDGLTFLENESITGSAIRPAGRFYHKRLA